MRDTAKQVHARLQEKVDTYAAAAESGDPGQVAEALAGIVGVVRGAAVEHGVDLGRVAEPAEPAEPVEPVEPAEPVEIAVPKQRLAAYALLRRDEEVLLTRISRLGHHAGFWTLPGGGVEHGEQVRAGLVREVHEETGFDVRVGRLRDVHSVHFTGRAPSGRLEDFHGVHLIFDAELLSAQLLPRVVETDGSTDRAAWVGVGEVERGEVRVLDVVRHALRSAG